MPSTAAKDWEDVKRLAADFQRAQLSTTVQRLSDRNCIEIIGKLTQLKLLEVIHTCDGKEYLTHQELVKEIKEELQAHNGRINLVDLQQIINVDLSHIEVKANEILRNDHNLTLVLGQLVDKSYLDAIAEEVNDKLQEVGCVSLADITRTYDLPASFLVQSIEERVGTIIQGRLDQLDSRVLYTEAYVAREASKIRGLFSGVTRPTPIHNLLQKHQFQERLMYKLLDELIDSGRLCGSVSGAHTERGVYVPDVYTRAQQDYVTNFYRQNGYLEYDQMSRLGISDPKNYIKKQFGGGGAGLVFLSTCCAGAAILEQVEAQVEEALAEQTWTDVMPLLPSCFSDKDAQQVVQHALNKRALRGGRQQQQQGHVVFGESIVASHTFVDNAMKIFDEIMVQKADKAACDSLLFVECEDVDKVLPVSLKESEHEEKPGKKESKKDERRKKAAVGKSGGGAQGRETRTKAVKNKYKGRRKDDDGSGSDGEVSKQAAAAGRAKQQTHGFLTVDEVQVKLEDNLKDCPEELVQGLAQYVHGPLTKVYQEILKSAFTASKAASSGQRKRTHDELQEKVNGLLTNLRLFQRAIKLFPQTADDVQSQLSRHLLKSVGSEVVDLCFSYLSVDLLGSQATSSPDTHDPHSHEVRNKLISRLPEPGKTALSKLVTSCNGKNVDEFIVQLEVTAGVCEVVLKKLDKKKERQVIFNHRQALLEELRGESEPAMALHLVTLLLFQSYSQAMLHASGKFVPAIIGYLRGDMPPDEHATLVAYQELVVKNLQGERDEAIGIQLVERLPKIKDLANAAKKSAKE